MRSLIPLLITLLCILSAKGQTALYSNPNAPIDARLDELISKMTLKEKVSQMQYRAPAIERLGIPKYNWWNEALHGVAISGLATSFPQAIGLAATWDISIYSKDKFCPHGTITLIASADQYIRLPIYVGLGNLPDSIQL